MLGLKLNHVSKRGHKQLPGSMLTDEQLDNLKHIFNEISFKMQTILIIETHLE